MSDRPSNHPQLEKALLQAVKYGLADDQTSLRQFAGRLVRRPPEDVVEPGAFREELGRLLLADDGQARALRQATAPALPRDIDSTLPLVVVGPDLPLEPPVLNDGDRAAVDDFVMEQREASRLADAGLVPARTLLLTGAPGVGKTMTARFVARSLSLPLVSLDLATLMSSYLGRTGQNLRKALDYARTTRCVLFLDEFDALAKRRDDDSDVGELKRLVNVLLLELERWPNESILIAATNHPELLDRAIERRFDLTIGLGLPNLQSRASLLSAYLGAARAAVSNGLIEACAVVTDGWSGSDIARLGRLVLRRGVLEEIPPGQALAQELTRSISGKADNGSRNDLARAAFCAIAAQEGGLSHREIARLVGVSHPTVGRLVQRWNAHLGEEGSLESS